MREARAELVRIDAQGLAHPIGTVASQRMRGREGTYRLLPAPEHVVFMRFTGEDGKRDAEDGAVVRLAGEITQPGAMCDVFALLGQTGWRGELLVMDGDAYRAMYFEKGNIVGAHTNQDEERLGNVMYRFGALSSEQLERIVDKVRGGARFGTVAVELGVLSNEQVYEYLRRQIEEIAFATLMISDGTFFFLDDFDDARLASRQLVSVNGLLMDGVTRMDEIRFFRERIPSSDYVATRVEATTGEPAEELRETLGLVDSERNIEELGRLTGRGEFAITKELYSLLQSKHVAIQPPPMSGGLPAIAAEANEALRAMHARADQGGKGAALRESLSSFAAGAGVYDILFRGAGPDESGVFLATEVADNAKLVAHGSSAEVQLRQMMHEYVSFALFSAGSLLGPESEAELNKEVGARLGRLNPR
jgi:hypothetical protein